MREERGKGGGEASAGYKKDGVSSSSASPSPLVPPPLCQGSLQRVLGQRTAQCSLPVDHRHEKEQRETGGGSNPPAKNNDSGSSRTFRVSPDIAQRIHTTAGKVLPHHGKIDDNKNQQPGTAIHAL